MRGRSAHWLSVVFKYCTSTSMFLLLHSAGRSSQRQIETGKGDRRGADEERDGKMCAGTKGVKSL